MTIDLDMILHGAAIYGGGALAYTFFLGFTGSDMTWPRMLGVLIWPIMVAHALGVIALILWREVF